MHQRGKYKTKQISLTNLFFIFYFPLGYISAAVGQGLTGGQHESTGTRGDDAGQGLRIFGGDVKRMVGKL